MKQSALTFHIFWLTHLLPTRCFSLSLFFRPLGAFGTWSLFLHCSRVMQLIVRGVLLIQSTPQAAADPTLGRATGYFLSMCSLYGEKCPVTDNVELSNHYLYTSAGKYGFPRIRYTRTAPSRACNSQQEYLIPSTIRISHRINLQVPNKGRSVCFLSYHPTDFSLVSTGLWVCISGFEMHQATVALGKKWSGCRFRSSRITIVV